MADTELLKAVKAYTLKPPDTVREMQTLDRSRFDQHVDVLAVRVPATLCSTYTKQLAPWLLNLPRLKSIVPDPQHPDDKSRRLVLLSPAITAQEQLPQNVQSYCAEHSGEWTSHVVTVGYDYWNADDVLNAVLPVDTAEGAGSMATRSFETVGHLAHMNLRDRWGPYKQLIGAVILDKNPHIKTVVNKLESIDTTFRFFKMELLAGEPNYVTRVKENNCTFEFDYSKVYWNSRLGTEHKRLLDTFSKGEVIMDLMAGVGPFVIPACKRGCFVYGNDLNPASYAAMVNNAKLNKLPHTRYKITNLDARAAAAHVVTACLHDATTSPWPTQVVMNLPASAIDFLDIFRGLYADCPGDTKLPTINVYCFSKAADVAADAVARVQAVLGTDLPRDHFHVHDVRDVAPQKRMLCVSFRLPPEVAFARTDEPASKRQRCE